MKLHSFYLGQSSTQRSRLYRHLLIPMLILRYISMNQVGCAMILSWLPMTASEEITNTLVEHFMEVYVM